MATRDNNEYMREYLHRRYHERHDKAIAILGGRCVVCGSTDDLQIDHVNNSHKSFDIADRLAQYTWSRIVEELKKCQLLCFWCHVDKSRVETKERNKRRSHE